MRKRCGWLNACAVLLRRIKLKAFHKFEDTAEAVQSATALVEGKLSSGMKKFLKKNVISKELSVSCAPDACGLK